MAEIQSLPDEVAAQIKSSVTITSLSDVVIGLLKNSLDADSARIDVELDFRRGSCWVEDDGDGIAPPDFAADAGLGELYHTSRLDCCGPCHGQHGIFLASAAALSILTITSRHHLHESTNALIFHHSRPAARLLPAPAHLALEGRRHGTRVFVQDLFGNMPVRVRQRPSEDDRSSARAREWDAICKGVVGLLLAWHRPVSLSLKCADTDQQLRIRPPRSAALNSGTSSEKLMSRIFDVAQVSAIFAQGLGISPSSLSRWVKASARALHVTLRGLVSLKPAPTRNSQFMCIGVQYLDHDGIWSALYDEVNDLFSNSYFGSTVEEDNSVFANADPQKDRRYRRSNPTPRKVHAGTKGIDRWPSFFIRIDVDDSARADSRQHLRGPEASTILSSISQVLKAMISGFLTQYHFRHQRSSLQETSKDVRQDEEIRTGDRLISDSAHYHSPGAGGDRTRFDFHSNIRVGSAASTLNQSSRPVSAPKQNMKIQKTPEARTEKRNSSTPGSGSTNGQNAPSPEPQRLEDGDEVTVWTDPNTNERLLLNARTGFVVDEAALNADMASENGEMRTGTARRTMERRIPRLKPQCPENFMKPRSGTWASDFIGSWENPVFERTEEQIPQMLPQEDIYEKLLGSRDLGSLRLTEAFGQVEEARLKKADLAESQVIAQVDAKFILVRLLSSSSRSSSSLFDRDFLVLIDQHAADERIKVEKLLEGLCQKPSRSSEVIQTKLGYTSSVETCTLAKSIVYEINGKEHGLFETHAPHFAQWGILYDLGLKSATVASRSKEADSRACRLDVLALPPCIAERCRTEPKLLIEMLRGEAWKLETSKDRVLQSVPDELETSASWVRRIQGCPQGILDMINSRACRSAIMFNDELSLGECHELVQKVSQCVFPFQCAHGRPSMVPLVSLGAGDLGIVSGEVGSTGNTENVDINSSWDEWIMNR